MRLVYLSLCGRGRAAYAIEPLFSAWKSAREQEVAERPLGSAIAAQRFRNRESLAHVHCRCLMAKAKTKYARGKPNCRVFRKLLSRFPSRGRKASVPFMG